jgi:hypothetical protein
MQQVLLLGVSGDIGGEEAAARHDLETLLAGIG